MFNKLIAFINTLKEIAAARLFTRHILNSVKSVESMSVELGKTLDTIFSNDIVTNSIKTIATDHKEALFIIANEFKVFAEVVGRLVDGGSDDAIKTGDEIRSIMKEYKSKDKYSTSANEEEILPKISSKTRIEFVRSLKEDLDQLFGYNNANYWYTIDQDVIYMYAHVSDVSLLYKVETLLARKDVEVKIKMNELEDPVHMMIVTLTLRNCSKIFTEEAKNSIRVVEDFLV